MRLKLTASARLAGGVSVQSAPVISGLDCRYSEQPRGAKRQQANETVFSYVYDSHEWYSTSGGTDDSIQVSCGCRNNWLAAVTWDNRKSHSNERRRFRRRTLNYDVENPDAKQWIIFSRHLSNAWGAIDGRGFAKVGMTSWIFLPSFSVGVWPGVYKRAFCDDSPPFHHHLPSALTT